jgi:hypothetical protein
VPVDGPYLLIQSTSGNVTVLLLINFSARRHTSSLIFRSGVQAVNMIGVEAGINRGNNGLQK